MPALRVQIPQAIGLTVTMVNVIAGEGFREAARNIVDMHLGKTSEKRMAAEATQRVGIFVVDAFVLLMAYFIPAMQYQALSVFTAVERRPEGGRETNDR